jgi:uncharacterized protein
MELILSAYKIDEVVSVHHEYDAAKLDLEFVDLKYVKPITMTGTVEKSLEVLTFRGHLVSDTEHICGRCLKTVPDHVDKPFDLYYEVKDKTSIETTEDLREILIFDHPIRFVCSSACKGLCAECGADLNKSTCNCRANSGRFDAMSSLKEAWERKHGGKKKNG